MDIHDSLISNYSTSSLLKIFAIDDEASNEDIRDIFEYYLIFKVFF